MSEVLQRPEAHAQDSGSKRASGSAGGFIKTRVGELLARLQIVGGIIDGRTSLPVLKHVLLRKRGSTVLFKTSDLESELETAGEVGVGDEAMETTLPHRKLHDLLKTLPPQADVAFKTDGHKVVMTSGKSRFTLQTLPAEDFPSMKAAEGSGATFQCPKAALRSMIDLVKVAMAVKDIRYYLNGVLIEVSGKTMRLVATDGHRLSTTATELESKVEPTSMLLPRQAALELHRLIGDEDGDVTISVSKNQAKFEFDDVTLTSVLLDGAFPNYRRVLPQEAHPTSIKLERRFLLDAIHRVSLMSDGKASGIKLTVKKNTLVLFATNPEQEDGTEEFGIDYEGKTFAIGFNSKYLIDAVTTTKAELIELQLKDGESSMVIVEPDHPSYMHVLMPMRI